jgi:hypothetical protein
MPNFYVIMTADAYCGFVMPCSFSATDEEVLTREYGSAYAEARVKMANTLLEYSLNYAGLRLMHAKQADYDRIIDELHAAALRLSSEARTMYERVQAARDTTQAVEFRWTLCEPMVLMTEQDPTTHRHSPAPSLRHHLLYLNYVQSTCYLLPCNFDFSNEHVVLQQPSVVHSIRYTVLFKILYACNVFT